MKREERKIYNSLKKTVTPDTLYVEIPTAWTHEARQAIHELLTVEKGMIATVIGPDCCTFEETIRYTHSSEATKAIRQAQEVTDIDEVMKALRHTDYTWNGYKANEEEPATEEPAQTQTGSKEEEKKMENTVKCTYEEKTRNGYQVTWETTDAEQVYSDLAHELISKKINACSYIRSIKQTPLYNGTQKITVNYDHGGRRIYVVSDH